MAKNLTRNTRKNPHIGSSFESWLDAEGIRAEVTAAAVKAVISRQLAAEMQKKKITKQRMAELMQNKPRASGSPARSGQRQRHHRELAARRPDRGARTADAAGVIGIAPIRVLAVPE